MVVVCSSVREITSAKLIHACKFLLVHNIYICGIWYIVGKGKSNVSANVIISSECMYLAREQFYWFMLRMAVIIGSKTVFYDIRIPYIYNSSFSLLKSLINILPCNVMQ